MTRILKRVGRRQDSKLIIVGPVLGPPPMFSNTPWDTTFSNITRPTTSGRLGAVSPSHAGGVAMPKIATSRSACGQSPLGAMNMGARRRVEGFNDNGGHTGGKQARTDFVSHPSRPLETRSTGRACECKPFRFRRASLLRASSTPTPTAACARRRQACRR